MFIGHYAVGFAAKRFAPGVSLGTFFMAAIWLDLVWPVLLLLGIEQLKIVPGITAVSPFDFAYYPFSHSLTAGIIWSACLGLAYFICRRSPLSALVIGITVLSHWFLDAIVHIPDLPLTFTGEERIGLGLWNSALGTILLEGGIFVIGAGVYLRSTCPLDKIGRYGLLSLMLLLVMIYAGQFFGAVPPNESVVAFTGLSQWLFVLFAFWVDRHRQASAS
ncbi:MAG: hypothetical protein HYS21_01665 [Deltaproteobacteria bacterium]|nr:hypothetical protein [Deltaproteobacteria bacterium]